MNKEFVMRGKTASGGTEVLNFSGNKPGYAYRLVDFTIFPSVAIPTTVFEAVGTITAGKTAVSPPDPDFNDPGLLATVQFSMHASNYYGSGLKVINDTFLITQDLILMVFEQEAGNAVNWQCRFVAEKVNTSEEAVANFKQFTIFDG